MADITRSTVKPRQSTSPISYSQMLATQARRHRLFKLMSFGLVLLIAVGAYSYLKLNLRLPFKEQPALTTQQVSEPIPATEALISLTAQGPIPSTIHIASGGVLTWNNDDSVDHTIEFTNNQDYSSNVLKAGDSFTITFETPGEYHYSDPSDPAMSGIVIVD
jgi:plastocyanin